MTKDPDATPDGQGRLEPATGPQRVPRRLVMPPRVVEHTHWSWGLVGFYASCAGAALGATFAASGHWFFDSERWVVFGAVMCVACSVTCYLTLRAARRPSRPPGSLPRE